MIKRIVDHAVDGNRWRYLARSLAGCWRAERNRCPNCGGEPAETLGTKMLVTRLRRCGQCRMLFRSPTDPPAFGAAFYQEDYEQGFTTDCPSDDQLAKYLESGFSNTPKDFSEKIALLHALKVPKGARILDYGASWGYGTYQFCKAGFDCVGVEPGRSRARYAREKLHQDVREDIGEAEGPFDVFFSSHVIEHVPQPHASFALAKALLRPGGLFIAFTPNGSEAYLKRNAKGFHNHWGMVHPNYLDCEFYQQAFRGWPLLLTGTPADMDALGEWNQQDARVLDLSGWELLAIAVRPQSP